MSIVTVFSSAVIITLLFIWGFRGSLMSPSSGSEIKTLISSLLNFFQQGYTEDYKVNEHGLKAIKSGKVYMPYQVRIVEYQHFEGSHGILDESILYAIETNDGGKGVLVDDYGPSSDIKVIEFIQKVEEIYKDKISQEF